MNVTTTPGEVLRDQDGVRLEYLRAYDQPVGTVWSALTGPARVAQWLGVVSGDPGTGTVSLAMTEAGGGPPETVRILECVVPERLVVDLSGPDGTWRLAVALQPGDGGTTLVFTHRLTEPYDASSIGPGWHYYLDRLGAVVTGSAVPESWDDYYPALSDRYAVPAPPA